MSRILIVDDEKNMRKILASNLTQDGHVIIEAAVLRTHAHVSARTASTRSLPTRRCRMVPGSMCLPP